MDNHLHNLNEHQKFLREFIQIYKELPCLWDRNHPQYKSRIDRSESYEILVKKCKEYVNEADEDYVRLRIDSMRSSFRKERKKVIQSRNEDSEYVYRPSLWYYDLLLFTVGEEANEEDSITDEKNILSNDNVVKNEDDNVVKIPFWGREYSSLLIELYKTHTCLYSLDDPDYKSKVRRFQAFHKITEELKRRTGKIFVVEDVRRKIHLLRGQFMYEFRKIHKHKTEGNKYVPTLWCYNMLAFLKKHVIKMECMLKNGSKKKSSSSMDVEIKKEFDFSSDHLETIKNEEDGDIFWDKEENTMEFEDIENDTINSSNAEDKLEDSYDNFGKIVAKRLRDMDKSQYKIAQRLIHDVLYHAQMENLTERSKLSL